MANEYFISRFNTKVYKLALDGGMNCPNRTKDKKGGCIFCSSGGSGDFAEKQCGNIKLQIDNAIKRVESKKPQKFIAYFQSYTNTYAPISYLRQLFFEAISDERVCALSIATRPDCLPAPVLQLLGELNAIKPVFVELGLQTSNDETATLINRGYKTQVYFDAVKSLKNIGVNVITHVIIGLPNETQTDILNTVKAVNESGSDGIKLQLMHVLKNTPLCSMYENGQYVALEKDEYIRLLILCLKNLRNGMVVHRITGDAPKRLLVAPLWSADKKRVLNDINKAIKENL
ncbi:MAG: TIGR01212 family radical SAM protein [Clostridiales bacterium]|nr:TIGR01212 family radical SAM protein [Clostridiales bacterium]